MPRYVALLRAINVGGHTVKMDRLKALFEALDFANVETFIASGNVLFDAKGAVSTLTARIEAHLAEALGYEVKTFLRTRDELAAVVAARPFGDVVLTGDARIFVGFLAGAPSADARRKLTALEGPANALAVEGTELHWLCREKMSDSKLGGGVFERTLGMGATFRNLTTVTKLAAILSGEGAKRSDASRAKKAAAKRPAAKDATPAVRAKPANEKARATARKSAKR